MKMSITFDGFEKMASELNELTGDIKPAVTEALEETQKYIQQELETAVAPYSGGNSHKGKVGQKYSFAEGDMAKAIIDEPEIEWSGNVAKVKVGFSSYGGATWEGFMHSIFVMYGVPAHGKFNRGYAKDAKVYNAIRGVRTKKQIEKIQKEVLQKYLKLGR